jgi:hypothetical protein
MARGNRRRLPSGAEVSPWRREAEGGRLAAKAVAPLVDTIAINNAIIRRNTVILEKYCALIKPLFYKISTD